MNFHCLSFRIDIGTLAVTHKAVNLGQGFIDYDPPQYLLDIYDQILHERNTTLHQYTRGFVGFIFAKRELFVFD